MLQSDCVATFNHLSENEVYKISGRLKDSNDDKHLPTLVRWICDIKNGPMTVQIYVKNEKLEISHHVHSIKYNQLSYESFWICRKNE